MSFKKTLLSIFRWVLNLMPKNNFGDKIISIILFFTSHGRLPGNKKLISEYLFKLKTSDSAYHPLRAYTSDKEYVKDYVSFKIGAEYNVPTIKVLKNYDEVIAYNFPERCCIKPTHASGRVIFRKNGEKIDYELIKKWLSINYYSHGREKNYRFLEPKIIVEPLIFDKTNNEDFKFFCFEGKAKFIQIDFDRHSDHTRLYFNRDWVKQDFSILKPQAKKHLSKPENYEKMLSVADNLSKDFEFIRVDLYTDGSTIYVGELTNWPENGNGYFVPAESERLASDILFNKFK